MNKKGTIGEILTQFPSIIFLLLVIIAYILVSTFIIRDNIQSYNLVDDFLDDYVVHDGKVLTVNDLAKSFCENKVTNQNVRSLLSNHFFEKYGSSDLFVLTYTSDESPAPVYWGGFISNYINEGTVSDYLEYNKLVDLSMSDNSRRICNGVWVYARGDL